MTDRELLELAAKAVGLYVKYPVEDHDDRLLGLKVKPHRQAGRYTSVHWNPLTDDGDALRLAVKLNMSVEIEMWNEDKPAATRLAIVRAAAEVGKTLP